MRYPAFLPSKGTIGVVAPSFGVAGFPYEDRYQSAKSFFIKQGYTIKECQHLTGIEKAASAPAAIRAFEFMDMYLDESVDFVNSVAGGEMMMEILPYLDFDKLKQAKPKWFMGMSDNTNLVFTLNTKCDVASIYGSNFTAFNMRKWYRSLKENYKFMKGEQLQQVSFPKHEYKDPDFVQLDPFAGYNLKKKVKYQAIDGLNHTFRGRTIGGCLDILTLLVGTPFGQIDDYLEKYQKDGFIWFLEACDLNVLAQKRALWQLKQAGWFKYCKGILYGRPLLGDEMFGITIENLLIDVLGDLKVPVVYGCDFGHVAPCLTIISGALAQFELKDNKGYISYDLK